MWHKGVRWHHVESDILKEGPGAKTSQNAEHLVSKSCLKQIPLTLLYKPHQIPNLKCFSSRLEVVFAQSIEARCKAENEDIVGAAPSGETPTTSEWSTIVLPTKAYIRGLTVRVCITDLKRIAVWIVCPHIMQDLELYIQSIRFCCFYTKTVTAKLLFTKMH